MQLQNPFNVITRTMEAYLLEVLCRADNHEYTVRDISIMIGTARSIGGIRAGFDRLVPRGSSFNGNTATCSPTS